MQSFESPQGINSNMLILQAKPQLVFDKASARFFQVVFMYKTTNSSP